MNRLKAIVAAILVLIWTPVASYCLVQDCGFTKKGDCCPEEQSAPPSVPHTCDKPCGMLASGSYLPQQDRLTVIAPADAVVLYDAVVIDIDTTDTIKLLLPSSEPPELAVSWAFSFRAALPPRAPSSLC